MKSPEEKAVTSELKRIQNALRHHTDIQYLGSIYFHGERAHLYASVHDGKQHAIVADNHNRFFMSTGRHDPNYYLEITGML